MPVYIVRWNNPDPAVCLVSAPNKTSAFRLMDNIIADPGYCEIEEYKGFLLVNIDLGIKSHYEEIGKSCVPHTVVDDVSECLDEPNMVVSLEIETALDVIRIAFPHYSSYFDQRLDDQDTPAALDECKKAIQQDFDDIEKRIRDKLEPETEDAVEQAEDILRKTEEE